MLTVQVIKQHRLVAMHPNKAISFSAATVHTAAAENVGPEARREGMLGGPTRVNKIVHDGNLEACWECCTHCIGKTRSKTWVDTWNWATGEVGREEGPP